MKMLSVERISSLRSIGTDAGTLGSGKATAPVPHESVAVKVKVKAAAAPEPAPSLINQIGQSGKTSTAGIVYSNTADPTQRYSATEPPTHDWRLKTPEPEKADNRPALPEMLIEHLKSIWVASALAVQTPQPKDEKSALTFDAAALSKTELSAPSGMALRSAPGLVKNPLPA